jgi:hypothetical protein
VGRRGKLRARGNAALDFEADFRIAMGERVNPEGVADPLGLDDEGRRLIIPAPNAIEFIVGKEWVDADTLYEHPRQYQVIRDYFQLRCPICNRGGSGMNEPGDLLPIGASGKPEPRSRTYMESEILLVWDGGAGEDVCPKCRTTRNEFFRDGLLVAHDQLHGVAGQRSGKSFTSAYMGVYMEHRILTLAHGHSDGLHGYLHIDKAEQFEITFLASNEVQSAETIWAKFTGIRARAPWFQRYVRWLKRQELLQPTYAGKREWEYKELDKEIVNRHPKVRTLLNSMNSNSAGLRGRTRIGAFADEISHMQQTDSPQGADEVYRALENSLATVRGQVARFNKLYWLGSMVSVTSPKTREDKGMRLLRAAPKIDKMYSFHYETWHFNPSLPEEQFADAKEKDPVGWRRDFKADPPGADSPLIHDPIRFRDLVTAPELKPTSSFDYYNFEDDVGQAYVATRVLKAEYIHDPWPRYVVFDAGATFDAFAGACAHGEWREDEQGTPRLVTVYDWVIRMLPNVGTEVYFDCVFDLVKAVSQKQRIVRVEFDRWNSLQLIQQIRVKLGIPAEHQPTKHQHYIDFRTAAFNGLLEMLPLEEDDVDQEDPTLMTPQACALYEMEGLQIDPDTQKVKNPKKGERRGWNSDDVAQCVVHVNRLVQEQGYTKKHDDRTRRAARQRLEAGASNFGKRGTVANMGAARSTFRHWGASKRGW